MGNEEEEGDSNDDTKSILGADKANHETFYNDQIFRQLFLGFEVESEEGRWFDPEFKDKEGVTGEEVAAELEDKREVANNLREEEDIAVDIEMEEVQPLNAKQ